MKHDVYIVILYWNNFHCGEINKMQWNYFIYKVKSLRYDELISLLRFHSDLD